MSIGFKEAFQGLGVKKTEMESVKKSSVSEALMLSSQGRVSDDFSLEWRFLALSPRQP